MQLIFSQIFAIDTLQLTCEGEIWGVFCELKTSDLYSALVMAALYVI